MTKTKKNKSSASIQQSQKQRSQSIRNSISSHRSKPHWSRIKGVSFVDRELAWLEFNQRVLEQAEDESLRLLERVKFLSICHSNLDEFFMKRVDYLRRPAIEKSYSRDEDERGSLDRLNIVRRRVEKLLSDMDRVYLSSLKPQLTANKIDLLEWDELTKEEKINANEIFYKKIFPILTPLAVDPGHPFPHISNLSTSLAIALKYPKGQELFFSRVKIPEIFPAWTSLDSSGTTERLRFISIADIILHNLDALFPNMEITATMLFRITRNIDVERDEEAAEDLLEMIEQEIKDRRFGEVVKLEHGPQPDPWLLNFLKAELDIESYDIYELKGLVNFTSLSPIYRLNIPELREENWTSLVPDRLVEEPISLFHLIAETDLLVHHPYESFTASVEKFIRSAAEDPKVLAIKMTLYRTNEDSPFIRALIRAAEAGKQVVCLVELKARMEEEKNINWANKLEEAGVHVVYGIVGLKTHCKVALVIRQESDRLRSYAHIGTGNYNAQTAKLYTDIGFMTANEDITKELIELFHHLTGRSLKDDYEKLLVAPYNMKQKFLRMIEREAENQQKGLPAGIIAKMNSLEDRDIGTALYKASQAGVKIKLIVRGICTLRPGVEGLSESIEVISIVDRFLEHGRIFYFRNAAKEIVDGEFYLGSADWMSRNLHGRVEVVTPIENPDLKERLLEIFEIQLEDFHNAWVMQPDGSYKRRLPTADSPPLSSQNVFMELTRIRHLHRKEKK